MWPANVVCLNWTASPHCCFAGCLFGDEYFTLAVYRFAGRDLANERKFVNSHDCNLGTVCSYPEGITNFDIASGDLAGGQLDDTPKLEAHRGHSIGQEVVPKFENAKVTVQSNNIDRELHKESMDAGGGSYPQSPPGIQFTPTQETYHPSERRVCNLDTIP